MVQFNHNHNNEVPLVEFNPDWSSPPSDTIKDVLEERGGNYDDFVGEASRSTGWYIDYVERMFDGEENMQTGLAGFLAKTLGSTPEFWIKRSVDYRIRQETKKKFTNPPKWKPTIHLDPDHIEYGKIFDTLERILSNCLSAQIKREDSPCSSETHLNTAIALLSELIPDYNPDDEEIRSALEWAIDESKILRGEK